MMRTYCTYFDRNYVYKAICLIDSLNRHEKNPFQLLAVCLDEISRTIINKLNLPHVTAVPIHLLEERDEPLLEAKKNRSLVEYYFTLTPTIILRLMERYNLPEITYVDADIYFFSPTDPIFAEFEGYSVMIHEHRFSPRHHHRKIYGRYNVGLLCFRNDERGLHVLKWWRDRCIEWCYAKLENGKYADQLYLDDWTERFEGVRVLKNIGAGVAPWNHDQYTFHQDEEGRIFVDNLPLIFYHYHALTIINPDVMVLDKFNVYLMNEKILHLLFLPYVQALVKSIKRVSAILSDFDFGFNPETPVQTTTTFVARKAFISQLRDTTALPQKEIDLDNDWRGYLAAPAMVISIMLPASPPRISIVTPVLNKGSFLEECIDSILSQNYPNLKYIIMDGGSADDTIRIIKKYEKHLAYWRSLPDRELFAAINEGFKHTDGEIMTWLNADDKLHQNALTTVSSIFSQYPAIHWLTGRPNGFSERGDHPWATHPLPVWSREHLLQKRYNNQMIQQGGTFWSRNLWERTGAALNSDILHAGDFDLWIRFFRHAQLYTVDSMLAGVRTYEDRKTELFRKKYAAEAEKLLDREIALWQTGIEAAMMPAAPLIVIHFEERDADRNLIKMGESLYQAGEIDKAIAAFRQAVEQKQELPAAYNNLGVLYWQRGEEDKALHYLAMSIKEMPSYKPAVTNYARILISMNRISGALAVCNDYLQEHPADRDIMEIIRTARPPNSVE